MPAEWSVTSTTPGSAGDAGPQQTLDALTNRHLRQATALAAAFERIRTSPGRRRRLTRPRWAAIAGSTSASSTRRAPPRELPPAPAVRPPSPGLTNRTAVTSGTAAHNSARCARPAEAPPPATARLQRHDAVVGRDDAQRAAAGDDVGMTLRSSTATTSAVRSVTPASRPAAARRRRLGRGLSVERRFEVGHEVLEGLEADRQSQEVSGTGDDGPSMLRRGSIRLSTPPREVARLNTRTRAARARRARPTGHPDGQHATEPAAHLPGRDLMAGMARHPG